ncbi:MAG: hypothetical protein IJG61_08225, partial [Lachnospiraceae bacterium]|nr:hypothetical protein [Lachnospiraceae bacterium]
VSLKELDALIATEAMQVPPAYEVSQYVINTGNGIGAIAHMKLKLHGQPLEWAFSRAFRSDPVSS